MRIVTFLLLLLQGVFLQAQFSMEKFLAASVADAELLEVQNSLRYLEDHHFNSPWIREVDLRLRSNDTQIGLEDYRMRFGLINPFEIKANADYHRTLGNTLEAEKAVKQSDVIKQRYYLLIENIDLNALRRLAEDKLEALRNVESLYKSNLNPSELSDWFDLQSDITKTELSVRTLDQKLKVNEFLIRERLPEADTISLDTTLIVRDEQVFLVLEELNDSDQPGLLMILNEHRGAHRASELALERAENRSNIGYIQAEYDKNRGNQFNEHAGFQVGIALPLVNPKRPDYQREVLKRLEEESKDQLATIQQERQLKVKSIDFANQRDNLDFFKQKMNEIKPMEPLMNTPKLYLDYLKYSQFLEENYLAKRSELMRTFINLLHEKGQFLDGPAVNYISRDFTSY